MQARLPEGLNAGNFSSAPFLVFNRKDDVQSQWVAKAFGLRAPRLQLRYLPSSEGYVKAVCLGWGIGVASELQVRPLIASGQLQALHSEVSVDVALYWHQWKLQSELAAAPTRVALLDQIGLALAAGARLALTEA